MSKSGISSIAPHAVQTVTSTRPLSTPGSQSASGPPLSTSISDLKSLLASFQTKLGEFNSSVSVLFERSHELVRLTRDDANDSTVTNNTSASRLPNPQSTTVSRPVLAESKPQTIPSSLSTHTSRDDTKKTLSGDESSDWDNSDDDDIAVAPASQTVTTSAKPDLLNTEEGPGALKQYAPVLRDITQVIFTPPQARNRGTVGVIRNLGGSTSSASEASISNESFMAGRHIGSPSTRVSSQMSATASTVSDDFLEQLDYLGQTLPDQKASPTAIARLGAPATGAQWTEEGWVNLEESDPTVDAVMEIELPEEYSGSSSASSARDTYPSGISPAPRTLSQPLPQRSQRPSQVVDIRTARVDPDVRQDAQAILDFDETELHTTSTRPALIRPMGEAGMKLMMQMTSSQPTVAPGNRPNLMEDGEQFPDDIDAIDLEDPSFASNVSLDPTSAVKPLTEEPSGKSPKGVAKPANRQQSPGLKRVGLPPSRAGSSRNTTPVGSADGTKEDYPDDIDAAMDSDFDCDETTVRAVENQRSFVASVAAQQAKQGGSAHSVTITKNPKQFAGTLDALDGLEDDDDSNVERMRARRLARQAKSQGRPIDNASRALHEFELPKALVDVFTAQEEDLRKTLDAGLFVRNEASSNPRFLPGYKTPKEIKQELVKQNAI